MQVKIAYDFEEKEYIAFLDGIATISGYGKSEKEALLDLLHHAKNEKGFNYKVISVLIEKIESS